MFANRRSPEPTDALTLRTSVRRAFDAATQSRGNRYFERGMVVGARALPPDGVRGDVMGSSLYEVSVRLVGETRELGVSCSCPVGEKYGEPCKHVWALLREIDARDLLPAGRSVEKLRVRLRPERDRHDDLEGHADEEHEYVAHGEQVKAAPGQDPRALLDALLVRRGRSLAESVEPAL